MVCLNREVNTVSVVKYTVKLTDIEKANLAVITTKGKATAKVILHADVLVSADVSNGPAHSEKEIARILHINAQTVHTVRRKYCTAGLEATLSRKKRKTPPRAPKLTGEVEAKIIVLSCSSPPDGRAKWTLRLLAYRIIEMQIVESISHESVHRLLKKTN